MPTFDASGTAYNPTAVGPRTKPGTRWKFELSSDPAGRPVVADGLVYVPTGSGLQALDANSGTRQWQFGSNSEWPTAPTVHDGVAYTGSSTGKQVFALDAKSGKKRWAFTADYEDTVTPIVGDSGQVFVGDGDGDVYALDAKTGKRLWKRNVFGPVSTLSQQGSSLYVGTEGGEVSVFATRDGSGHWRRRFPAAIRSIAIGRGSDVYVGTHSSRVYRLKNGAFAGKIAWTSKRSVSLASSLVVTDRTVFGADSDGLLATNRNSGSTRWFASGNYSCGPAGAGDTIYLGGSNRIVAHKLTGGFGTAGIRFGGQRWSQTLDGNVRRGLAVANGAVFAVVGGGLSSSPAVYALG